MSRCSVVLSTQVLQLLRPWHLYGTSLAGTASIRNGPEKWFHENLRPVSHRSTCAGVLWPGNTRSGLQEVALRHRARRLEVGATGYVHSNSITRVMGFCMFCPFGVPLSGS